MSKKSSTQCYLCGKFGKTTDDHIPPKNLAPKNSNLEFIHGPACAECNNKLSHEESKFRDFLAVACSGLGIVEADNAFEAFQRSLNRNTLGRAGRPPKDLVRIWEGIRQQDIYTARGNIYLGKTITISPAHDINIEAVLVKIARGIHYAHSRVVVPNEYEKRAALYNTVPYPDELHRMPLAGNIGDFFQYRGGWLSEDRKSGLWYMCFYKKLIGLAYFCPPGLMPEFEANQANLRSIGEDTAQ
jgi:hypothetical protein